VKCIIIRQLGLLCFSEYKGITANAGHYTKLICEISNQKR